MALLSALKTQIADELRRSDLTSQIATALQGAVDHYESWRWWFLEFSNNTSVTTVANQAAYDQTTDNLPDAIDFDFIKITISGNEYRLNKRDQQYIQDRIWSLTSGTGVPEDWSFYDDKLWLYPVPNAAYQLHLYGIKSIGLPADNAENAWTKDGYDLIRQRAKAIVKIDVLDQLTAKQEAMSVAQTQRAPLSMMERAALKALISENEKRTTQAVTTGSGLLGSRSTRVA